MTLRIKNIDQKYILMYRIIWCILAWIPLIMMIYTNLSSLSPYSFMLFSSFTFQSNLFVALWFTLNIILYKKDLKPKILHPSVHGAITLYISVTFVIFVILLAPLYIPTGIQIFTNLMVHYLIPIAMIIEWIVTGSNSEYKWSYEWYWMIYPIGYLIYSLFLGGFFNIYIYPFFDITKIGLLGLIIAIIGLTTFFILLGALYIFMNRTLYKKLQVKE